MRCLALAACLLACATTAWAGESASSDAPRVAGTYLDLPPLQGAPSGRGILTPWGYLDVSLSSAATSVPLRVMLDPKAEASPRPAPAVASPYLAVGRVEPFDGDLPAAVKGPTSDKLAPLKTAVGLSLGLGRNAELTGEYQFLGVNDSGLGARQSAGDRPLTTGHDSFGLNFSLSIKY
jgi:hypothetical protein